MVNGLGWSSGAEEFVQDLWSRFAWILGIDPLAYMVGNRKCASIRMEPGLVSVRAV